MSWLQGRELTRDQATTATILAETVATEVLRFDNPMWTAVDGWAAELGLTRPDAVGRVAEPLDD